MPIFNFIIQNNAVTLVDTLNDSETELKNGFVNRENAVINIYSNSILVNKLKFSEIGTINGVTPINLDNARDLISSLIDSVSVISEQQAQTNKLTEIANAKDNYELFDRFIAEL